MRKVIAAAVLFAAAAAGLLQSALHRPSWDDFFADVRSGTVGSDLPAATGGANPSALVVDHTDRLWLVPAETGARVELLQMSPAGHQVPPILVRNGLAVANGDVESVAIRLPAGEVLYRRPRNPDALQVMPGLGGQEDLSFVEVTEPGRFAIRLGSGSLASSVPVPEGWHVLGGGPTALVLLSNGGQLRGWDPSTGHVAWEIEGTDLSVAAVAISATVVCDDQCRDIHILGPRGHHRVTRLPDSDEIRLASAAFDETNERVILAFGDVQRDVTWLVESDMDLRPLQWRAIAGRVDVGPLSGCPDGGFLSLADGRVWWMRDIPTLAVSRISLPVPAREAAAWCVPAKSRLEKLKES